MWHPSEVDEARGGQEPRTEKRQGLYGDDKSLDDPNVPEKLRQEEYAENKAVDETDGAEDHGGM